MVRHRPANPAAAHFYRLPLKRCRYAGFAAHLPCRGIGVGHDRPEERTHSAGRATKPSRALASLETLKRAHPGTELGDLPLYGRDLGPHDDVLLHDASHLLRSGQQEREDLGLVFFDG